MIGPKIAVSSKNCVKKDYFQKLAIFTKCAERIFDEILKSINKTYIESKFIFQGFRIYFVWNPRIKGIESTTYLGCLAHAAHVGQIG